MTKETYLNLQRANLDQAIKLGKIALNTAYSIQTLFKNNSEKYEYLIIHNPQNDWIEKFKQTKEYRLLYE